MRTVVILLSPILLAFCQEILAAAPSWTLIAVPSAPLEKLAPVVRKQLQTMQQDLLGSNRTTKTLAMRFGELGQHYHAYAIYASAQACYRNAEGLDPSDFRWPYLLGHVYGDDKQGTEGLQKAAQAYRRALAITPDYPPALNALAEVYVALNQHEQAQHWFAAVLKNYPNNVAAHAGLGRLALQAAEAQEAIVHLEKALTLQAQATQLHHPLAMAYRSLGDRQQALAHLKLHGDGPVHIYDPLLAALDHLRTGSVAQVSLGLRLLGQKKYQEAEAVFAKAVLLDANSIAAQLNHGVSQLILQRYSLAITSLQKAVSLAPENGQAHYNLALAYSLARQNAKAIPHLQKAVELNPGYSKALLRLGEAQSHEGQFEQAQQHFHKAIALAPNHELAYQRRFFALLPLRRYSEAMAVLQAARKRFPRSRVLLHAEVRMLAACPVRPLRNGEKALRLAQNFATGSVEEQISVAMALAEQGRFSEAVTLQEKLIARGGSARKRAILAEDLLRYQAKKASQMPWQDDDPIFTPALF